MLTFFTFLHMWDTTDKHTQKESHSLKELKIKFLL